MSEIHDAFDSLVEDFRTEDWEDQPHDSEGTKRSKAKFRCLRDAMRASPGIPGHFSMKEIAAAVGIPVEGDGGISYGVSTLDIPLADGRTLTFRQGDDDSDREVTAQVQAPMPAVWVFKSDTFELVIPNGWEQCASGASVRCLVGPAWVPVSQNTLPDGEGIFIRPKFPVQVDEQEEI